MIKLNLKIETNLKNLTSNLRQNFSSGSIVNHTVKLLREAQRKVLDRYDQTYKGFKKRGTKEGAKGDLRKALAFMPIVTSQGNVVSAGIIPMSKLPSYWRIQEEGADPSMWQQTFHIVGVRSSPSSRGDHWVLKSFKKGKAPKGLKTLEITISHPGVKARRFIQAGEEFLMKEGYARTREWFRCNWVKSIRSKGGR